MINIGGAHHSGAHPIGAHNHQAEAQAKFMHDMQEVDRIGHQAMQKHHDIEATHAHANLFGDMTELASAVRRPKLKDTVPNYTQIFLPDQQTL